jgi:CRISPR-associated endonuclease/helicase Cas3
MSRGLSKAERLLEMERLYFQRAYSDIEMAERLGVDRTTAFRDRIELETQVPFIEVEKGRWKIDRSRYLSEIRLNLNEALALYLSARRASQQTRIAQPHTASALEKLALALRQPMTDRLVRSADKILTQNAQPERVKVLEIITRSWVEAIKVRIAYQGLQARKARHFVVSPYLIEPSPWSDGTYLIGYSDVHDEIASFKVERIESAALTTEPFTIPANFNEQTLLQHAWGIWAEEGEPETVTLRFAPGVAARRLRESIWHPSQTITELDDSGCTWTAKVAEWHEMLPWVRGWGADVEVIGPKGLRQELIREAGRIGRLYHVLKAVESEKMYYAHSKEGLDKSEWQLLKEHLVNTGSLAFELGRDAGISDLARVAGLFHDIGKYSQAFQQRLDGGKRRVDHATAGAREVIRLFPTEPHKAFADLLSYCIAGHHSGLPDHGNPGDMESEPTLLARREKKRLEDYSAYKTEIDPSAMIFAPRSLQPVKQHPWFSISFLTRMVFSTLVDADWLETETYMEGAKPRGGHASIQELCQRLSQYLRRYENPQGAVNRKRNETLKACIGKAAEKPGFFTLTVPTGGGKTLASMAFALNHAVAHGLKRIVYVIPFTSIIEQNAAIFKEFLGEENVLEHHSSFDWQQDEKSGDDETNNIRSKLKLAVENWDIPIVVTTNVQFFESLFANKKSRARKVHNLAKSAIIFDEAQMLPREYLHPCMLAVRELVLNYGASAIFCTATQPDLQQFLPETSATELAPNPQALFDFYRRVQIKQVGKMPDSEVARQLNARPQVLCIVNTRRHAKGMFNLLEEGGRFHLSTLMCPAHRKETLATIRQRLQAEQTCRVISTQVMEAGVDLDFPVGYRALAGLDSIVQAAGRVNREGRNPSGEVYVFEPETDCIKRTPAFIRQTASAAASILRDFGDDPATLQAIQAYFKLLDTLQDPQRSYDVQQILACLDKPGFDFKTAAEKFKLIDDRATVSVIIPYDQAARSLLEKARYSPFPASYARSLQVYTVNLYQREFESLQVKGAIETYQDLYFVLTNAQYYDAQTGVILPADEGGEAIFFD